MENKIANICSMLSIYDADTAAHCQRTAIYVEALCSMMCIAEGNTRAIKVAAVIHDIGKTQVPLKILHKRGPLCSYEYELLKEHPGFGASILRDMDIPEEIVQIVLCHHEHWNGGGYPHGHQKENIPLGARILAVCDSIDAMLQNRCYRRALTPEACLNELTSNHGKMYDPQIIDTTTKHWLEIVRLHHSFIGIDFTPMVTYNVIA